MTSDVAQDPDHRDGSDSNRRRGRGKKKMTKSFRDVKKSEENVKTLIRMGDIPMMEMMKKAINPMAGRKAEAARKKRLRERKEPKEETQMTTETHRISLDSKTDMIPKVTMSPSRCMIMSRMIVDKRGSPDEI